MHDCGGGGKNDDDLENDGIIFKQESWKVVMKSAKYFPGWSIFHVIFWLKVDSPGTNLRLLLICSNFSHSVLKIFSTCD